MLSGLFFNRRWSARLNPLACRMWFWHDVMGPFMNACSQAIWQAKVAPDVQGRVFSVRRAIAWSSGIIAPLLAAPLADYFFKPGMIAGGWLAPVFWPHFRHRGQSRRRIVDQPVGDLDVCRGSHRPRHPTDSPRRIGSSDHVASPAIKESANITAG